MSLTEPLPLERICRRTDLRVRSAADRLLHHLEELRDSHHDVEGRARLDAVERAVEDILWALDHFIDQRHQDQELERNPLPFDLSRAVERSAKKAAPGPENGAWVFA